MNVYQDDNVNKISIIESVEIMIRDFSTFSIMKQRTNLSFVLKFSLVAVNIPIPNTKIIYVAVGIDLVILVYWPIQFF